MNFKYSWLGEILATLARHAYVAAFVSILWCIMPVVAESKVGGIIFTVVSLAVYALSMISVGKSICKNDKKSYTKLNPIWYKGAVLPVAIEFLNIVFVVTYILIWKNFHSENGFSTIFAVVMNLICIVWFSPYQKLFMASNGNISIYTYIIVMALPIVFSFVGYYFGIKNIDVTKKLNFLVYEKNKKGR